MVIIISNNVNIFDRIGIQSLACALGIIMFPSGLKNPRDGIYLPYLISLPLSLPSPWELKGIVEKLVGTIKLKCIFTPH